MYVCIFIFYFTVIINKIPRYCQWMDIYLSICMVKLCQRSHRSL